MTDRAEFGGTPTAPPNLPLPTDAELDEPTRELLANLPPLNVFRALATLPDSLRPFMRLGGSLLTDEAIDARVRETAILRVAHVTGAGYEWAQHEQIGRAVGLGDAEIEALRSDDPSSALDEDGALAARVAEEVSRDVRLSDEALESLLERYGPRGAASLILCVSYYNMVSRFLESARVEIEAEPLLSGTTPQEFASGPPRSGSLEASGNVALARSTIGDLQALFGLFDDSVVIDNTPMGDDILPEFLGRFRGKKEVIRSITDYVGAWDDFTFEVEEIIEAGDSVLLMVHETGIGKRSRIPMVNRHCQMWTFKDDRIVRITTFKDKEQALAAATMNR